MNSRSNRRQRTAPPAASSALPTEVHLLVFSFLPTVEVTTRCIRVSRWWRDTVLVAVSRWRSLSVSIPMSDAHLKMLLVHCRQVRRLVVAEVLSVEEDQDTVSPVEVQQCARLLERFSATLERADISGLCDKQGRPPPSLLQALYKCKALRKIEWWGVYLPPPQLRELIRGMPLLEGLGVDNVDAF